MSALGARITRVALVMMVLTCFSITDIELSSVRYKSDLFLWCSDLWSSWTVLAGGGGFLHNDDTCMTPLCGPFSHDWRGKTKSNGVAFVGTVEGNFSVDHAVGTSFSP